MLAALIAVVAAAGANIEALAAFGIEDHGHVRFVVDDPNVARAALREAGVAFIEHSVLTTVVRNRPGELASLTQALAGCRVNIEAIYLLSTSNGEQSFAIAVDDATKLDDELLDATATGS
jgi:hypothetical protein